MVAEVAKSDVAAFVKDAAAGLSAERAPLRLLRREDSGLEAAEGGDGLRGPAAGSMLADGGRAEGSGQSCSVEHMQLEIRRGLPGKNASVVTPPDGQHPALLWFWPQVEKGGRQQPYPTVGAAGSN